MHLSFDIPAPGYPGMVGTLLHVGRGVDQFVCPGEPGLVGSLNIIPKSRDLVRGVVPGLCRSLQKSGRDFAQRCNC